MALVRVKFKACGIFFVPRARLGVLATKTLAAAAKN